MALNRWRPGEIILQEQYTYAHSQSILVRAVTVVEDRPEYLALYSHLGSRFASKDSLVNRPSIPLDERVRVYLSGELLDHFEERPVRRHVLTLNLPGADHSVWLFWDKDWNLLNWYVNLQPPFVRTPRGIQVTDYYLDLIISPSLDWAWKDEDEFEAMCQAGAFTNEQRLAIRSEGERMARRVETREWPFDQDWPNWRPDPRWTVPRITDYWPRPGA